MQRIASNWRRKKKAGCAIIRRHGSRGAPPAPAPAPRADGRVELATGEVMDGPDWGLNLDICDTINSFEWQAKDVVEAITKRLLHKNPGVQTLALTLLETMIKNCRENVHRQIAQSSILQELVSIVKKKTDTELSQRILVLLESWQEAFGGQNGKFPQFYRAYAELKISGIKFPKRSAKHRHHHTRHGNSTKSNMEHHEDMTTEIGNLSLSDLVSMRRVMELLSDMLQAVNPKDNTAVNDEVIIDLVHQCRSNQQKIMHLVSSTGDEELLGLGLVLNDKLRTLIAKHDSIAYGSPLKEPSETASRGSVSTTTGTSSVDIVDEDNDEEDGFSQLARRNSNLKSVPHDSFSIEGKGQGNCADRFAGTLDTRNQITSQFITSDPFSFSDFPKAIVEAITKEDDIFDNRSIVPVSSVSSHHPAPFSTSLVHSKAFNANESIVSNSLKFDDQPSNPWLYTTDHGCIPYDNYIVPWAQEHLPQDSSSYPPPPWEIDTDDSNDTDTSTTYQPTHVLPTFHSEPLQEYNPIGLSREDQIGPLPLQGDHSFGPAPSNWNVSSNFQQPSFRATANDSFSSNPFDGPFPSDGNGSSVLKQDLFDSASTHQNHLPRPGENECLVSESLDEKKPLEQEANLKDHQLHLNGDSMR